GALVQCKAMDPQGNLDRMYKQVQSAALNGVEAILFGETCIHTFCVLPENLALSEELGGPITKRVSGWAKEHNMLIMAGMLEKSAEGIHNAMLLAFPDGYVRTVRQYFINHVEIEAGIVPGPHERFIFDLNGVRCGMLVCADSAVESLQKELDDNGVELAFCPAAGGGFREEYVTDAELATAEGMVKFLSDSARSYICGPRNSPRDFRRASVGVNAYGDDGAFMVHRGGVNIVNRHRIVQARIWDMCCVDYFTDQICHTVLHF
ncbi:MAG: carbon-nitrogen hydrolase family protein, partial [Defluviitaleaceae bacterium]|nr:carbon-nitrogen hydrolase family protein [Defluviitaleaceae bacterium]